MARVSRYMVDIRGDVYGRLVIGRFVGCTPRGKSLWEATCECGSVVIVGAADVRLGQTRSCGCMKSDMLAARNRLRGKPTKGGFQREYNSWISAKRRCLDMTDKDFPRYGGAGVIFASVWADSFAAFCDHMGKRPQGTTLDRIDNAKGYEPGNCRWATPKEQALNRRSSRWFDLNGERVSTQEVAAHFGVTPCAIFKRIREKGTLDGYNPRGTGKKQRQAGATGAGRAPVS